MDLKDIIRTIPDFPKTGVNFIDITPILKNPQAFRETVNLLCDLGKELGITSVVGIESRGFIFGAPVALELNVNFVPIRKPGKLPAETISESYSLEYGTDTIEMHKDALEVGEKVFLIDDLLATGGTIGAAAKLVEKTGAEITKIAFIIELSFLNDREKISEYDVSSLLIL